jgi:alkylated DNA repair protein (DNA oxidative demethylase)
MQTPMGAAMSAAMTNCGPLGWTADAQGYRYSAVDPLSGRPWPAIPAVVLELARATAARAGYPDFEPDACLINRYAAGARMGLHRDADEPDEQAPIVSVSLGLPARLQWGGLRRRDPTRTWTLEHGDVLVFGGPARRAFHGIRPIAPGEHPATGALRFNLTLRRAAPP